ncbi:long-chain-fatty-acid-CoA ligase [Halalkalibacter hemicellulosilyticusJCM 9152]|uniref:Long-chain-fatty-acid-CoA ligase n=2 Tax=Halalkalibacter TaxID=2893056 RepID=W4QMP8_9BACI|nr:long-chain-fatty-acid-CoA ligase [Halalkalibacter hemicellulosilyticusJCM 9152]
MLTRKVYQFAKSNDTDSFIILLTTFKLLLCHYTAQTNITLGMLVKNKNIIYKTEMFAKPIIVKTQINLNRTFTDQLSEIKDGLFTLIEEESTSKNKEFNLCSGNNTNLYNVMFESNDDLSGEEIEHNTDALHNIDLKLNSSEGETIRVSIEYKTNLFKEDTIQRFAQHFKNLLQEMIRSPKVPLKHVCFLSKYEKKQILKVFNDNYTNYPKNKTIHEIFENQVQNSPDKVAVTFNGLSYTYKQLNERSNEIAYALRNEGIKTNQIVGLMLDSPLDMVISMLGVLKAGGVYLPIDMAYPVNRIEFIAENSGAQYLLAKQQIFKTLYFKGTLIDLDRINNSQVPLKNLKTDHISSSDLAYVMYTSGTTGRPKGVCISHRNVIRLVKNTNYIRLNSDVNILQTGAFGFDATTFEVWGALLNGGTLNLIDKPTLLDINLLKQKLKETRSDTMWLTSPLFNQLVDKDYTLFAPLNNLLVGGDELSTKHINLIKTNYPQMKIINGYGPTENTTFSTTYEVDRIFEDKIPIGKPISNTSAYILNQYKQIQPIGVIGELYLGGDGISRGYLNNPKLTNEKFIENPFNKNEKLYRTGDLAKWRSDGNIEFCGRIDHQVKIRGFRIELNEIETVLLSHKEIIKGYITVKEHPKNREKQLCAYYETINNRRLDEADLRKFINNFLPSYMIPKYMIKLDHFPLNANGKIDLNALPEPEYYVPMENESYPKFSKKTEEKLLTIWEQVLEIPNINLNEHFYDLGGDSLTATNLHARIQKEFGIEFPLSEILINPSIESLAKKLKEKSTNTLIPIPLTNEKDYYPMSPQQSRMYMQQEMHPNLTNYNVKMIIDVKSEINVSRLENSLKELINRHESLRTSFLYQEGKIVQKINKEVELEIETYEGEGLNGIPTSRPFDLSVAPLIRVGLVNQNNIQKIILEFHHIIVDGISVKILLQELEELYEGKELPSVQLQYKDYSEWLNNDRSHKIIESQSGYWLETFKEDVQTLNLPTDRKKNNDDLSSATYNFSIGTKQTSLVRDLANQEDATLFQVLLTIYNIFLMKITNQEDITVGTPVSGRNYPGLEKTVGMFVNTLCLRNYPQQNLKFSDFLNQVKERMVSAFDNQDYPFESLVQHVVNERKYNENPLFNTMIALQSFRLHNMKFMDGNVNISTEHNQYAMFDLNMQIYVEEDHLLVDWEYLKDIFTLETMKQFESYFTVILEIVTVDPNILIGEINILNPKEIKKKQVPQINLPF